MIGYSVSSEPLELAFYALAGGAILYVIGEIWHGMRRYGHRELGLILLACGFSAGIITDFVVVYGGGTTNPSRTSASRRTPRSS